MDVYFEMNSFVFVKPCVKILWNDPLTVFERHMLQLTDGLS